MVKSKLSPRTFFSIHYLASLWPILGPFQPAITCSKLTRKALEHDVKYIRN